MVFIGSGSDSQQGLYLANMVPIPPPISPIVDTNTEVAGGSGNFSGFQPEPPPIVPPNPVAPNISGRYAVFFGAGIDDQQGIYIVDILLPTPPPIVPVADITTAIPGGLGNFTFFKASASENNDVAFVGGAAGVDLVNVGVYKALNVLQPQPPPIKVADLFTAVPAGIGNFTAFGSLAIDPGTVVFEGFSNDGVGGTHKGLYTDFGGELSKIVATGDTLGGKTVSGLRLARAALATIRRCSRWTSATARTRSISRRCRYARSASAAFIRLSVVRTDGRDVRRPGSRIQAKEHRTGEDDASFVRRTAPHDRRAHYPGRQIQQLYDVRSAR